MPPCDKIARMGVDFFAAAVVWVISNEGGSLFTDAPLDRGGPTKYGVTLATLSIARKRPCTASDVRLMGLAEAEEIYRAHYWSPLGLGGLVDAAVATASLDAAVLCGPEVAAKALQRAVGAEPDGCVGPLTLAAANAAVPAETLAAMVARLDAYLNGIVARSPSQGIWLAGWKKRIGRYVALPLALAGKC